MDQKLAFFKTVELAREHGLRRRPGTPLGLVHLFDMWKRISTEDFPEDKLGRWLGWAQCVVVSANIGVTMEDMMKLNTECKLSLTE